MCGWLIAFVIVVTTGVTPALIEPQPAAAALLDPISCGRLYAVDQHGSSGRIYTVDRNSAALTVNNLALAPGWPSLNGLAVDEAGGDFWMVGQRTDQTSTTIVRVDAATGAQATFAQTLTEAPDSNGGLVMGAFNPDNGIYYYGLVDASNVLSIWGFDTRTNTALPGIVGRVSVPGGGGDFAIDRSGRMYVVSQGVLMVLTAPIPAVGSSGRGPELSGTVITNLPGNSVGSMAFGPDGYLYVAGRTLYRLNPSTGEVAGSEEISPATNSLADMASCASPNVITVVKELPAGRARPDDQFRLAITGGGLTAGNKGVTRGRESGVQDQTPGEVAGPALGLSGTTYTITESAAGSTDLAAYDSSWECIDRVTGDLVADGTGPSGSFDLPAAAARSAEVRCTFTNRPRAVSNGRPDLEITKSVDPVSGSTVTPGQSVGYTLRFSNTGTAPGAVAVDDVIGELLDDAILTSTPVSSDPALTVSDLADGRFTVSGRLPSGRTVTVGYEVQVKPDSRRGDHVLRDFVVAEGEDPPTECKLDELLCSVHPVPTLAVTKSVDPKDGSVVGAGTSTSYTLTLTNPGPVPAAVGFDDVITGVLDDAALVSGPTSSDPAVTVSAVTDGRFTVSGTVKPGQTVTVGYSVTVAPDGHRGDDTLINFVVDPGAEVGECGADDPLCTENPVRRERSVR